MAEQDSSQERSEEATPKRRQDAKEKGDIARSKELNTTAILLAGSGSLLVFGASIGAAIERMTRFNFEFTREDVFNMDAMGAHLVSSMVESFAGLLPFFFTVLIAALLGPIALGGWVMSGKSLAPKWSRIDPLAGIKRLFSRRSLMELFKSLGKFLIVAILTVVLLLKLQQDLLTLGKQDVMPAMLHSVAVVGWSLLALSSTMIIITLIDVPFQLWDYSKKLKMTRQEIKDEFKNTEGKPEVKSKIRQLQREMSQRRMMSAVPEADVVITNPEHYAVALIYNSDEMRAPVMVAKGADFVAQKIREVAKANNVPIIASPPLARAVFYSTEIDDEIPSGLYVAVAQVLAYVFQLRRYKQGKGQKPGSLPEVPIPESLKHD